MAFIEVEKGNPKDVGKRFLLREKAQVIGRQTPQTTPDIPLNDDYVSRRHAEIAFESGHFLLRDLGSTNGTAIDDVRIEPARSYPLTHESSIALGIASGNARVLLRFKETPTVSTVRIEPDYGGLARSPAWMRIDDNKGEVWADGRLLALSRKEYDLIVFLCGRAGKICQRDELISVVWPEVLDSAGVSDAAIDQLIHRLRVKIEPDPTQPSRIVSRKGFGYMLQ